MRNRMNSINIKKLTVTATTPTYGTTGAACFDLYADSVNLQSWGVIVDTGIAFEVPEGYVMMVYSRSGMGFKNGIVLRNGTGVIDSDFRDSVKVALCASVDLSVTRDNSDVESLINIQRGDRIAQAMIIPVTQSTFNEVSELSDTTRGTNGLGSTGQ